jgi:hypothetical protein
MAPSRILAIEREIEANTIKLDEYFAENGLPSPSFEENAPLMYQFSPDLAAAQETLSAALDELWWLTQGPIQTIVAKSVCLLINLLYISRKYRLKPLVCYIRGPQDYSQIQHPQPRFP